MFRPSGSGHRLILTSSTCGLFPVCLCVLDARKLQFSAPEVSVCFAVPTVQESHKPPCGKQPNPTSTCNDTGGGGVHNKLELPFKVTASSAADRLFLCAAAAVTDGKKAAELQASAQRLHTHTHTYTADSPHDSPRRGSN